MRYATRAGLLGAGLVACLLGLGLGWGPAALTVAPERLALFGLAATGLAWPLLVPRLARRLSLSGQPPSGPD